MSRRNRKQKNQNDSSSWLTTYSDMVTLLLAFFVLLFSFSTVDAQKWQALVDALTGNVGIIDGGQSFSTTPGIDDGSDLDNIADASDLFKDKVMASDDPGEVDDKSNQIKQQNDKEFVALYESISTYMEENNIDADVLINKAHTEILVRFRDYILFDTGKSDIKQKALNILNEIVLFINDNIDNINFIRVVGSADNRPINTYLYQTNWELSTDRAVKVVRYLQEEHGISGNKLVAAGYGEYHPIESNDTAEGRAKNRRVDIFIVRNVVDSKQIELDGE